MWFLQLLFEKATSPTTEHNNKKRLPFRFRANARKVIRTVVTNPNPEVGNSGGVGKAVLAQDPGFDGTKSSFF